jgi:hypothetical protein
MNVDNWNKPYINIKRLVKIFPTLKNNAEYYNLKIDEDSLKYITVKETAEEISKIICSHLIEIGINPLKIKLVDYTAGVGGNVLSFSNYFYEIVAIELSNIRTIYLKNNIGVYNYTNIKILNKSSIDYNNDEVIEYAPNVIFIDVPWGNMWNKTIENYRIIFGDMDLEKFILQIFDKFFIMHENNVRYNNYNNRLLVLKLPKNYDIEYFYNYIKDYKNNIYNIVSYIYILQKMLLIVIEYKFI